MDLGSPPLDAGECRADPMFLRTRDEVDGDWQRVPVDGSGRRHGLQLDHSSRVIRTWTLRIWARLPLKMPFIGGTSA